MILGNRLLLPLASETDARRTASAVISAFGEEAETFTIYPLHVIEKGGGAIDKTPVDAQHDQAETIFSTMIAKLEPAGFDVEPELVYGTDVVDAIANAAMELEASAIVFLPREGGTLSRLLAGDLSNKLLERTPIPVVVLPQPADGD